ncbi:MAG: 4Fe-4S binding protein [Pseudomonadota bacterium]
MENDQEVTAAEETSDSEESAPASQPPEPARKQTGKKRRRPEEVKIYRAWCKKCGICAAFCPKGALEMGSEGPEWRNPDLCVGCGMCELRCPDFAIEVIEPEEEHDEK